MNILNIVSKDSYKVTFSYNNGKDELNKWHIATLDEKEICNIEDYFKKHQNSKFLDVVIHGITKC